MLMLNNHNHFPVQTMRATAVLRLIGRRTRNWFPEAAVDDPPQGPTLAVAIEEQLGLKLEARKAPTEVVIVDHVHGRLMRTLHLLALI
jgi:uncharacterized protein (TIGR03435 family)